MQSENKTMGEMINAYYESITVTNLLKPKHRKSYLRPKSCLQIKKLSDSANGMDLNKTSLI